MRGCVSRSRLLFEEVSSNAGLGEEAVLIVWVNQSKAPCGEGC